MGKYDSIAEDVRSLHSIVESRAIAELAQVEAWSQRVFEQLRTAISEDSSNFECTNEAACSSGMVAFVDLFADFYEWRGEVKGNIEESTAVYKAFCNVLKCFSIAVERFSDICSYATKKGVVELVLTELEKDEFLKQRWLPADEERARVAIQLMMILASIAGRTSTAVRKFSSQRRSILRQYCEGDNYALTVIALFTFSYVAKEHERVPLTKEMADFVVSWLKNSLCEATPGSDLLSRCKTADLLEGLCQVANFDDDCVGKMVEAGLLDVLDAILVAPTPTAADKDKHNANANVLVKFADDVEKLLAVRFYWMAKFNEHVRKTMVAREATIKTLQKVANSTDNANLQLSSKDLLNSLMDARPSENVNQKGVSPKRLTSSCSKLLDRRSPMAQTKVKLPPLSADVRLSADSMEVASRDRVFVSYSHAQRKLVSQVVDALRAAGLNYIVTDQTMEGDWYTWMIEQVEKANIVLVCFSKDYFKSANCKEEAMNAVALKKKIIPLKMEDYDPTSWLGGIVRVRLWRVYWNPQLFTASISKLVEEITNYINGHEKSYRIRLAESETSSEAEPQSNNSHTFVAASTSASAMSLLSPYNASDSSGYSSSIIANIKSWDGPKTKAWLKSIAYPVDKTSSASIKNGKFVVALARIAQKSPQFLCESLMKHKNVGMDRTIQILGELDTLSSQF